MSTPMVTVVLPVYKVEKYLDRCMERVAGQTYPHLDILLIDDGSPDACPKICEAWAAKDARVRVIHKTNAGLGMARNTGIENARGEYICFFDSDDTIAPDTVEAAVALAERTQADVVTFGYRSVGAAGEETGAVIPRTDRAVYEGSAVTAEFLPELIAPNPDTGRATGLHAAAWASLYRLTVLRESGFRYASEREIIAEDVYSALLLYRHVRRVAVLPRALYEYRENSASLTHTFRRDRYEKIREFHRRSCVLCDELGYDPEVKRRLLGPMLSFAIAAMKQIEASDEPEGEKRRAIAQIVRDPYLHEQLRGARFRGDSAARRLLIAAMKLRRVWLCRAMLRLKK